LGCLGGMVLLKLFDSRRVLAVLTILALISFSVGLYSGSGIARWSFPLVGLFESVMWPIILSMALNSVREHHESLTGFLYTASIGGALGPFIIGFFSDLSGLRPSLHYIYLPLLFILFIAFKARPLVKNKTLI
jgi:MFS transporter, FHS family, L-fucose permease